MIVPIIEIRTPSVPIVEIRTPPKIHYVQALTTNVTIFGHRAVNEVIKVKWNHKNGALIQ